MVKKKVDPRVRGLIEHGVTTNHRSLFVLVGDHGKDQVENIHRMLSKTRVKSRPSVLWCYKKDLGFSTHKQKRMKEIKKQQARGLYDADRDDPFDLFISSTNIRWTYYKETENILGQTFGMCVLQDFEAITPNVLARTIETVEGGGIVIILLKTVKSLKQLYTMTMDVHNRFRTEAHHEVSQVTYQHISKYDSMSYLALLLFLLLVRWRSGLARLFVTLLYICLPTQPATAD
ncbi:tRNA(Met) cytidine acetyltransferase, partial [archaeon]